MRWSDPFEQLTVGERFDSAERTVRETDVLVFSALTGDWHPQHCDREWAASSPFGERIAHGMLVLSLAVGLVPLDPHRVLALRRVSDVVFKRPVRLDETITVSGEIAALRPIDSVSPEGETSGLVDFAWQIRNQDGALVCRASVQVVWRGDGAARPAGADESALGARASGRVIARKDRSQPWHEPITGDAAPGEFVPLPL
jgi:3-hydroxybutyryl-CoA dehydratase